MATIKLILRKVKSKYVICLYANIKGWKREVSKSTGILIDKTQWDRKAQKIKGRGEETKKQNLIVAQKKGIAADIIADYSLMKRKLTRARFIAELEDPQLRSDFLSFWSKKIEENYERGFLSKTAIMSERRAIRKVFKFSKGALSFSEINRSWLERFDHYHAKSFEDSRHDGFTERKRVLKILKKYLDSARGEIHGVKIAEPFKGFKWPKANPKPVSLSEDEVLRLIKVYQDIDFILDRMESIGIERGMDASHLAQYANRGGVDRLRRVMRPFLFQCATGVRFGDCLGMEYSNIEGEYLLFTPEKTIKSSGKVVKIWISPLMDFLIGERKSGRIFKQISNVKYNKYLKEIALVGGIKKILTSHVGRHTFASLGIEKGIPLPVLQDLMGLNSIKTLMIYVHTDQDMRDRYFKQAFGGIKGFNDE